MVDFLLSILYSFFAYLVGLLVDFVTAVIGVFPDPPFTFFSLVGNIVNVAPNFPFLLMVPGITAWAAIALVRLQLGAIRLFIKGWL
jgi:hypothetical protein